MISRSMLKDPERILNSWLKLHNPKFCNKTLYQFSVNTLVKRNCHTRRNCLYDMQNRNKNQCGFIRRGICMTQPVFENAKILENWESIIGG